MHMRFATSVARCHHFDQRARGLTSGAAGSSGGRAATSPVAGSSMRTTCRMYRSHVLRGTPNSGPSTCGQPDPQTSHAPVRPQSHPVMPQSHPVNTPAMPSHTPVMPQSCPGHAQQLRWRLLAAPPAAVALLRRDVQPPHLPQLPTGGPMRQKTNTQENQGSPRPPPPMRGKSASPQQKITGRRAACQRCPRPSRGSRAPRPP